MDSRRAITLILVTSLSLASILFLTLLSWFLLGQLGDERGAAAARTLSILAAGGLVIAQILLVNLLALAAMSEKIDRPA